MRVTVTRLTDIENADNKNKSKYQNEWKIQINPDIWKSFIKEFVHKTTDGLRDANRLFIQN